MGLSTLQCISFAFLSLVAVCGCAYVPTVGEKNYDCCGLTAKQWDHYFSKAETAVTNPTTWARLGKKMPLGVTIDHDHQHWHRLTDAGDAAPPTLVDVIVPVGESVKGADCVVVRFSHPSGEIRKIFASAGSFN